MEDNKLLEIEVFTPKLNDTERREFNPEVNDSQINPSIATHNKTVKKELFETLGGSTRESLYTNTNNKSRSTKIPAPKVATQLWRDSMVATSERSEGEVYPNRTTASASENVTKRRYQTRSVSEITRPRNLKDYFFSRITIQMKNLIPTYFF